MGCLDWWIMDYWLQPTELRAPPQLPRSRWKTAAQLYARHLIFTHISISIGRSTGRNFPSAGDFVKYFGYRGQKIAEPRVSTSFQFVVEAAGTVTISFALTQK